MYTFSRKFDEILILSPIYLNLDFRNKSFKYVYSAPLNWIVYKVLGKSGEILILGPYLHKSLTLMVFK